MSDKEGEPNGGSDPVYCVVATKEQYDISKAIYDEERERYTQLGTKANIYLTITSVLLGATLLRFDDLKSYLSITHVPMVYELIVSVALLLALSLTLHSLVIREYEPIQDLSVLVDELQNGVSGEQFLGNRIIDLAAATETNVEINDKSADDLQRAVCFLSLAVIVQSVVATAGIIRKMLLHDF